MNRNLLIFGFFLILLGVGFGVYLISFVGFLLLIPAFTTTPRVPPRPASSTPPREAPRRIIPLQKQQIATKQAQESAAPAAPQAAMHPPNLSPVTNTTTNLSYSPALFPSSIFPPFSSGGNPSPEPQAKSASGRDELVEGGAILVLLKLLLG